MAIFRLQIETVSRSSGRSATAAAAYRAGERIRDERTGALFNHSKRDDVLHKEIFLPSGIDGANAAMDWARDRSTLWNTAEKAAQRSDARVAREYQVALPPELSAEQRIVLARAFSREIADRYNVAVDLAIHAPRPEGDQRNFHAHLLATTREVTPEGMGSLAGLDMKDEARRERGLPRSREEFKALRARWAELTNQALREANVEARVDHRSLAAQGIDREPRARLPWGAFTAERRGERSEIAERIRERHRTQAAARRDRVAASDGNRRADNTIDSTATKPGAHQESAPAQDMDARRRQAVQDWLKYRASRGQATHGPGSSATPPPLSMDEIRQRAVAAWRSLRARGVESRPSAANAQQRDAARDGVEAEPEPGTASPGDGFSA